jgi:hypothetical protein
MKMKMHSNQFASIETRANIMRRAGRVRVIDPRVPLVHLLHYADANDAEICVNQRFFGALEYMAARVTLISPGDVIRVFTNFLIEARKLQRLEARGDPHVVWNLDFSIKLLLTHIPLQRWPLPHPDCCPCAFCDHLVAKGEVENHLAESHRELFYGGSFFSPLQLPLAGLVGLDQHVQRTAR